MPRAAKRTYHHGDLRRALLDAALAILARDGHHGLTLREVAQDVGVSQAAPYHHFADKEAILAAVAEEGFAKLLEAMESAREGAGPKAAARLRAIGGSYVEFAVRHPAHFRVMFDKLFDYTKYPSLHVTAERAFGALVDAIGEGQKAGVVRRGSTQELALLAWSTVHGLSMLWIGGALQGAAESGYAIEPLTEAATAMLMRGLGRT